MNKILSIYILLCLFIFCFVGDFIAGITGAYYIRFLSFLGFCFFFLLYVYREKSVHLLRITICIVLVCIFYIQMRHNTECFSAFFTILLGYLLFREREYSYKILDYLFIIQFILALTELIFSQHLYTDTVMGVFNAQVVDGENLVKTVSMEGFRPKGLFPGSLIAVSFNIYYSLLNHKSKRRTGWAFLLSLILNGRLGMIITGVTFLLHYRKSFIYSRRARLRIIAIVSVICIIVSVVVANNPNVALKFERTVNVFNTEEASNVGRLFSYGLAAETYLSYNTKEKLFGGEYELYNELGQVISAESDLLGMLLEYGLVGASIYVIAIMILLFKKYNNESFWNNGKMMALLTLFAYLEYRHATGSGRGSLFWMLFFVNYYECYPTYQYCNNNYLLRFFFTNRNSELEII